MNTKANRDLLGTKIGDCLTVESNITMISSLDVAIYFEIEHSKVMCDINEMIASDKSFYNVLFKPSEYTDKNGVKQPYYLMDKVDFMFLTSKYTDKESIRSEILDAFEELERVIINSLFYENFSQYFDLNI